MDETGLFWRSAPSNGLASEKRAGTKKDKSRISLVVCVNFTGSHRLPIWVIGKAQKPRALKRANLQAIGLEWRANQKAWMTTLVMNDWLKAFYASIEPSRSVLLLMDNLRAHISGVEITPPPSNIRIQWLPPNATSLYQPLDQGIINAIKLGYRKAWIHYMIQEYGEVRNPLKSMNLYLAVKWISRVWSSEISDGTIYRCFRRAKILPEQQPISLPIEPLPTLSSLYQSLQNVAQVPDIVDINEFLNPEDENIEDTNQLGEPDIAEIIARHIGDAPNEDSDEMEDEQVEIIVPTAKEALAAIELVQRYKEHHATTTSDEMKALSRMQRSVELELGTQQQQSTLHSWLT